MIEPTDYPAIAHRYRSGETLDEIGRAYGVTRERIRQILAKMGVSREEGGAAIRKLRNARRRKAAKEAAMMKRHGCTIAEWEKIRGDGPYSKSPQQAYLYQRRTARHRGIEWQFNLKTWWAVWEASGKWNQRGTGSGYCMARYHDTGPYAPWNVEIITGIENIASYYVRAHGCDPTATFEKWGIDDPKIV